MKQNSIEFLAKQLYPDYDISPADHKIVLKIIQQAAEAHKDEIIDAFAAGYTFACDMKIDETMYYNLNFNNGKFRI